MDVLKVILERSEWFWGLIREHLMLAGISILLAGTIGLLLGILIYEKKELSKIVLGLTNILYTIPDIAMFGFLIPLTGIGNRTAIIALTIYSLLPMVRNTYIGLEQVSPEIIEAAVGMGSTRLQMLTKVQLPLAFPVILTGMRSMIVMAISIAGIASFIGAGGLGQAIYRGIATNNQELMIAGSLIIAVIAILMDNLFGLLEKSPANRRRKFNANGNGAGKKKGFRMVICAIVAIAVITALIAPELKEKKQIVVGYDNTAEEAILANILINLIEDRTEISVEEMGNLSGGESVMLPAAQEGEIDIFPEYTGTAWLTVLKHKSIPDQAALVEQLKQEYKDKYNLEWAGLYGFNDAYGLAVTEELADRYNLVTYSDLARVSDEVTLGAEPGFYERRDGYDGLCRTYGFNFKAHKDITFSLKYDAVNEGTVNAIIVFTTDGKLQDSGMVVLKDDLEFFPKYLCGNVVRTETLDKYPELAAVLELTENILTDEDMSRLNKAVEVDGKEPEAVAKAFLKEKGLLS